MTAPSPSLPFPFRRDSAWARLQVPLALMALGASSLALANAPAAAQAPPPAAVPGRLQAQLLAEGPERLAAAARQSGDAQRGAILFYQPQLACTQCHSTEAGPAPLGPNLAIFDKPVTDSHLVESLLLPSKKIREGYETLSVVTSDGRTLSGLLAQETGENLVLRDLSRNGIRVTLKKSEIESRQPLAQSLMPAGLANQLSGRQAFLDLARYLMEVAERGPRRAAELKPPPSLYAARPLPAYEAEIDHAGMISDLGRDHFRRGEEIYNRLCINCHGTVDRPGSLPTSLRFADGKFKNGSDPYQMYQTLTKGFGMMVPQTWMVPQQKYDVIHYIREAYLKPHNPQQYFQPTADYLASLPAGRSRGPAPSNIQPWITMNYGPTLTGTYEIGSDGSNFAYKGIAVRLDQGPGGVSRGRHWVVFDEDTLRVAAVWSGEQFIDYNGIMFNGRHAIHPRITGDVQYENPTGPGWADPRDGSWADSRLQGRDERRYGPLPKAWGRFRGLYHHGNRAIFAYQIGDTAIWETPGLISAEDRPYFTRSFQIDPHSEPLTLQVAQLPPGQANLRSLAGRNGSAIAAGNLTAQTAKPATGPQPVSFEGATRVEVAGDAFDMTGQDYTIIARIKTRQGGTLFAKTKSGEQWVPDGKTLFVRGGRLVFDIGWVGAVTSDRPVADGKWHQVALRWSHESGQAQLFIDGKLHGQGVLRPQKAPEQHVVRLGYTSPNFPRPQSHFRGQLEDVRFVRGRIDPEQFNDKLPRGQLIAHWKPSAESDRVPDLSGNGHHGQLITGPSPAQTGALVAGFVPEDAPLRWSTDKSGNLRLHIPASSQPLRFTVWTSRAAGGAAPREVAATHPVVAPERPLTEWTQGGPPRWNQPVLTSIETQPAAGGEEAPFEVDVLTRPATNPWLCRVRLTGLDFFPESGRMAVCTWDGDVWLVDEQPATGKLQWRRIASGLFQPLGLKIVDRQIYVSCRDQICILRDLNGDGETDYYETFNNDHQVTEHFHEFAMGLQTDEAGNFYYAKSGRHAKQALVPHHGTLLKVTRDGARTEILAKGFRAANGVCVNPDGTFIVTDQEGHWNPKNRINWVQPGNRFYGNMWGYHDVTDPSDDAMEQPLCWITNAFDRSPAELLWVDSDRWGPLNGSLLNLSYGYGKIFVVPHERINGQVQGGMCELPLPAFPTGVMRGRFSPRDGALYACGMFAWAGTQQQPGGLYRIRSTGKPVHLPIGLQAREEALTIKFSGKLDPDAARDPRNYAVKAWDLKRSANYGSKHYNERTWEVASVQVTGDGAEVTLKIPQLKPTWGMEVRFQLASEQGHPVVGTIHNTIHNLRAAGPPGTTN